MNETSHSHTTLFMTETLIHELDNIDSYVSDTAQMVL
jgi:hypothetical protein